MEKEKNYYHGKSSHNNDLESTEMSRKKRQSENEFQDKENEHAKDIQDIFQAMLQSMVEGGKKIIQKVTEMIDPQAQGQQQPPQQ